MVGIGMFVYSDPSLQDCALKSFLLLDCHLLLLQRCLVSCYLPEDVFEDGIYVDAVASTALKVGYPAPSMLR